MLRSISDFKQTFQKTPQLKSKQYNEHLRSHIYHWAFAFYGLNTTSVVNRIHDFVLNWTITRMIPSWRICKDCGQMNLPTCHHFKMPMGGFTCEIRWLSMSHRHTKASKMPSKFECCLFASSCFLNDIAMIHYLFCFKLWTQLLFQKFSPK